MVINPCPQKDATFCNLKELIDHCLDKYRQILQAENFGQTMNEPPTEAQSQKMAERTIRTAHFAAFRSNVLNSNSAFTQVFSCQPSSIFRNQGDAEWNQSMLQCLLEEEKEIPSAVERLLLTKTPTHNSYLGCVYMDCREFSVDLPIADALNTCCKALRTIYKYKKVQSYG